MKCVVKAIQVPKGIRGPADFSQSLDVWGWETHHGQKEQHKQRQRGKNKRPVGCQWRKPGPNSAGLRCSEREDAGSRSSLRCGLHGAGPELREVATLSPELPGLPGSLLQHSPSACCVPDLGLGTRETAPSKAAMVPSFTVGAHGTVSTC